MNIPNDHFAQAESLILPMLEAQHAQGTAMAVIDREGNTLYQSLTGYRDAEKKLPLTQDTIFGLASVTKSFTCIAMLQLAEKGLLSLDDPVSLHLPGFHGRHHGKDVLIHHLMSHAGGYFPVYRRCIGPFAEQLQLDITKVDVGLHRGLAETGCKAVAEALDTQPLIAGPGEQFSYCNDGFGLLSEIIRLKAIENSFAEYIEKHICQPLGMQKSNAEFLRPANDPDHSLLYRLQDAQLIGDSDYTCRAFVLGGGGAMKSTLTDMKQYVRFLLSGEEGKSILSPASLQAMMTPRIPYSPVSQYGYGLMQRKLGEVITWGHSGSLPGVSSSILIAPEKGLGCVVLCNTEDVSASAAAEVLMRCAMGLEAAFTHDLFPTLPLSAFPTSVACGSYYTDEGDDFRLFEENRRLLLESGKTRREAEVIAPDTLQFHGKYGDSYLQLIRNEQGIIFAARYGSRVFAKRSAAERTPGDH